MSSDSDDGDVNESTIREIVRDELSGVSRRGVLAGGAGLLGSAALGGYAGRASAQTSSNGYIGSEQNPAGEIYAESIHAGTLTELDLEGTDLSLASLSTDESRTNSRTVTINVPSDYNTVSEGIAAIKELRFSSGLRYEINIESGHEWQDIVDLNRDDLRHVRIASEDSIVNVQSGYGPDYCLHADNQSVAPEWDILLDGQQELVGVAIRLRKASHCRIQFDKGVQNFDGDGIAVMTASTLIGNELISRDNTNRGIDAGNHGRIRASSADLTNNGTRAFRAGGGAIADIEGVDCSGSDKGIYASGCSLVDAGANGSASNLSNCSTYGVEARSGSIVNVSLANISSAGDTGIRAVNEATVAAEGGVDLTNCDRVVFTDDAARVNIPEADCSNASSDAIEARNGSYINARSATITTAGTNAVRATAGSRINIRGASATESSGDDISGAGGGVIINADSCVTSSATGSGPHQNDCWIDANNVSGDGILFARDFETA